MPKPSLVPPILIAAPFCDDDASFTQQSMVILAVPTPKPEQSTAEETSAAPVLPQAQLLEAKEFSSTVASLPFAADSDESLCMLVFGIDHLEALTARFGADVPDLLGARIAKLLAMKVDPGDQLGMYRKDRLAIVSHGVDLRLGMRFGKRVCKSLAAGQIAIHGQKIRLTVSVGVAATSDDRAASADELLTLANLRLEQAMVCGGNSVCSEHRPDCPLHRHDRGLVTLLRVLNGGEPAAEQKELLGLEVLPVLRALNTKLALGLSLADVEHRLARQASVVEERAS
jgi:diguanylate cyclase (GGDEF)-like protein